jgi:hypothetical protein
MKPICVRCQVQYQIKSIGTTVVDMFQNPPQPYKLWSGDLLECPGCGNLIVYGMPTQSFAAHFEPDFQERLAAFDTGAKRLVHETVYAYERPQTMCDSPAKSRKINRRK